MEGATPSVGIRVAAVALSVALAWLTFVCIEKPIRFGWQSAWRTPLLVLTMAVIGYVGLACKNSGGFPLRPIMQARVEANVGDIGHETFHAYYAKHFFACADPRVHAKSEKWGDLVRCFQTKVDGPVDLVMIGDSHAEHLLLGMAQALPHLNIAVYPRSELPFINSKEYTEIFESLVNDQHVKYVLLTSMWAVAPLSHVEKVVFESNLKETIKHLTAAGKHVVLTTDTPKFGFDPQRCKYKHPLSGQSGCDESSVSYRQISESYSSILESMTHVYPNVSLVRLDEQFCDESICRMAIDGRIMFRDNNHVNVLGSQLVGATLAKELLFLAPTLGSR